jgi:ABC-type uncharacterized transport system permease subunit
VEVKEEQMGDVKQELFKRLDIIGERLGVAANHLWAVLVRQGFATGIADAIVAVATLILALVAMKLARKWFGKAETETKLDFLFGCSIVAWIVAGILLIVCFTYTYDAALELVNPEYYALKTILEALK